MAGLSAFCADRYRGISGLELEDIAPFNLITGPNGIGKSSLVEALWLFHGRFHTGNFWRSTVQRSHQAITDPIVRLADGEGRLSGTEEGRTHTWRATFNATLNASTGVSRPEIDPAREQAELSPPTAGFLHIWLDDRKLEWDGERVMTTPTGLVRLPGRPTPLGRAVLVSAINVLGVGEETINEFGRLVASGRKARLIEDLRLIMPGIRDVETIVDKDGPYILATTDENLRLPLQALGGGIVRLFHILAAIRTAEAGMVLLDEVEIGLHHSVLRDFWKRLRRLALELKVQVFATTHSLECVDAAVSVFENDPDELAVHSLRRRADGSGIVAATFRGETLLGAREVNLEIR